MVERKTARRKHELNKSRGRLEKVSKIDLFFFTSKVRIMNTLHESVQKTHEEMFAKTLQSDIFVLFNAPTLVNYFFLLMSGKERRRKLN